MASIKLAGDTSGEITISAPAVAGTTTLTLPATSSTLATQNALGVRNLIINGDMRIAQRGTSVTGNTTGGYLTVDRFGTTMNTQGTWTQAQDTDVPNGQGFANSLKMTCTTADASPAAGDYVLLSTRFEGQNLQHIKKGTASAESLTLSFWVKSNKTGTYIMEFNDYDNSRSISKSYTINTADTWEKKTITFEGDTSGTLDNDNALSLGLNIWLGAGSDRTSGTLNTSWGTLVNANRVVGQVNLADSTSNYINITGVQLEVGDTATPFEHRPYDMELARCQRYYEKSYAVTTAPAGSDPFVTNVNPLNRGGGTGAVGYPIYYRVTKRANPTVTPYTYDGTSGQWHTGVIGSSEAKGNATIEDAGTNYFKVVVLYSTTPNAIYGHWVSSAEL